MAELIEVSVAGGIADVRLNRPEKYNALTLEMFCEIGDAAERVGATPGVRAIVLSGNGRGFSAGIDTSAFGSPGGGGASGKNMFERTGKSAANRFQRAACAWQDAPVPVIAAIHGIAYGAGLQIALGADIRIASPDAKLSVMEIKWGLIPDVGITQTLPAVVSRDVAKDLIFTGRVVSGEEANRLGLVTRVAAEPLEAALDLAREIAGKSPDAIRLGKQLLDEAWGADAETSLPLEAALQGKAMGSKNQREAVMANLENRTPVFEDS